MNSVRIEEIREQVRKLEAEIMSLKALPAITKVVDEINELYEIKWALERQVLNHAGRGCK